MGVRADDPDVDIRPWERQPNEPAKGYSILVEFLETKTLREAVARAQRETGDAASVRVPGHVSRMARRWQWHPRKEAYLEHVAKREHALFEEMRLARRKRRLAALDRAGTVISARLERMDLRKTPSAKVLELLTRINADEREELLDRPEDRERRREGKPLGSLPSLEEAMPKPSDERKENET
jgi:hypothetical protein